MRLTLIVTNNLEGSIGERRLNSSGESGASKLHNSVLRSSTGEISTICWVSPPSGRIINMGNSVFMNVIENSVLEVLNVDMVRRANVRSHAVLFLAAACNTVVKIMECHCFEQSVMFPHTS
jgi:hypothetical protein